MNATVKNISVGLVPLLGAAVLTGCGATQNAASSGASTTPPTSISHGTAPKAPAAPVSNPATAATGVTVRPCRATDVRFSLAYAGAGMGNDYTLLVTTNRSASACSLKGYPVLVHLVGTMTTGRPAVHDPGQPVTSVVLRPGQRAAATFDETNAYNYPGPACRMRTATALRVQLPGDPTTTVVLHRAQICTGSQYSWSVQAYTRNFTPVR